MTVWDERSVTHEAVNTTWYGFFHHTLIRSGTLDKNVKNPCVVFLKLTRVSTVTVYYAAHPHWPSTRMTLLYFRSETMWMGISSEWSGWAASCAINTLHTGLCIKSSYSLAEHCLTTVKRARSAVVFPCWPLLIPQAVTCLSVHTVVLLSLFVIMWINNF